MSFQEAIPLHLQFQQPAFKILISFDQYPILLLLLLTLNIIAARVVTQREAAADTADREDSQREALT
jgi:hypothetical protein